jgi:hypothetical protein
MNTKIMFKYIFFIILVFTGCSTDNKSELPVKNNLPQVQLLDLDETPGPTSGFG